MRWDCALRAAALVLCLSCGTGDTGARSTPPRPNNAASPAESVSVRSATIEYYVNGPTDPVVELRVVMENTHARHTDSTTILWDPEFARRFVFLRSEPAPWRTRLDESGWGTLDTDGVIPGQFTTFRLWFGVGTYVAVEPRVRIISNGNVEVADVTARATHLLWQVPKSEQFAFERGPLATAARAGAFVATDPRPVFLYALVVSVMLLGAGLLGGIQAYRALLR